MLAGLSEVVPVLDPSKFEVLGNDMQILNLKMSANEAVRSVPGAMVYMENEIAVRQLLSIPRPLVHSLVYLLAC